MLEILQVAVGIIFVMLLFSLLASTVLEYISGFLSLRGKQLLAAIQNMIGDRTGNEFIEHPFFQQLTVGSKESAKLGKKLRKLPSYINPGTFSSVLLDVLEIDTIEEAQYRIDNLPNAGQRKLLTFLLKQSNGNLLEFKSKIENWFGEVMDRASGSYKRNTQRWLFTIGLGIALIFNADVISIYHNLSVNSTLREVVAGAAGNYVNNNPVPHAPNLDSANVQVARDEIKRLVAENIGALESPLGLGWESVDRNKMDGKWWMYKLMGWFTMALGISFGATFWFEILKKIINIRAAGPAPVNAPLTTTTVTQSTPAQAQTVISSGSVLTHAPPDSLLEAVQSRKTSSPKPRRRRKPKTDSPAG